MRKPTLKNAANYVAMLLLATSLVWPVMSSAVGAPPLIDPCVADIDGDGRVSITDIVFFAEDFFSGNNPARSDFNGDGAVDLIDVTILAAALGTTGC